MITIHNESCIETMRKMQPNCVDVVLTSPFYNTNMTDDEYCDFTVELFQGFDKVLKENGSILYNINYGAENTSGMFLAVNDVITRTPFTIADVIVWKKSTALPNSCSPNRLTRIWEFVFVFCRKSEMKTFKCNKAVKSYRKTGQAAYENITNFIEAKNNDESCPYNKATYSSDLCMKLLEIYAVGGGSQFTILSSGAALPQ